MSEIVKFNFNSKTITCIVVNGNPWFKAKEVATILGYTNTTQAIIQHIDNDDKQTYTAILETLQVTSLSDKQLEGNEKNTIFINESGLYCLIFGSKKRDAVLFKQWVASEVLPSIRKHGRYESPAAAIERIRNPTGETELHYKVKKHIETTYPYVIISAGLGENQTTAFIRMDSKAKGYTKGQPDLELKCKLGNGFTDVVAIELKNPNGSNKTSPEQDAYLERLRGCNVATLVSSSYEEVIIFYARALQGRQGDAQYAPGDRGPLRGQTTSRMHQPSPGQRNLQQKKTSRRARLASSWTFRTTTTQPTGASNYRTRRSSSRNASTEA